MPKKHRKHQKQKQPLPLLSYGSVSTLIGSQSVKNDELMTVKVIKTRTIEFAYLSGDVLMTLDNVNKEDKWSSILEKIVTEEWYKTCKRWKFVFDLKNLNPDDVLNSDEDKIKIICVKIVPQIFFELSSGEFLVSVPFDSCRSHYGEVYLMGACFKAHKQLKMLGKNGYGTAKTKIYPLIRTHFSGEDENVCLPDKNSSVFRDKNGKELDLFDILDDPGDENLLIVVYPGTELCFQRCCEIAYGPLQIGEKPKAFYEYISLCSVCGFLHCLSCGGYQSNGENNVQSYYYCGECVIYDA